MKKFIVILAAITLLLTVNSALALEMIGEEEYIETYSTMTHDAVLEMTADQECEVTLRDPDEKAMLQLEEIYDFVWREGNRPVRYYDEETQQKIQELVPGVDIDIFHMTEFMTKLLIGEPEEPVRIDQLLDVEYREGQLVVVTLGVEEENGEYRWFPYRAVVPELGLITFVVPEEDFEYLAGKEVVYHVMTDRVGHRGGVVEHTETAAEPQIIPSKSSEDIAKVRRWYSESGAVMEDEFDIRLVELTGPMQAEAERIARYLDDEAEEHAAIDWFTAEAVEQARLLLPEVNLRDLIIYDIVAVEAKGYTEAYGDVATKNLFAAAYDPENRMVSMLGFPIPEAVEEPYMEWYCLRTEALNEEYVEIVFRQLTIPMMEQQPAMLVVLSEPIISTDE